MADSNIPFKASFISVVTVVDILVNILVTTVIIRHPQLREDRSTLFMLSLTVSDLCNGFTTMPLSAYFCMNNTVDVGSILKIHRFFIRLFAMVSLYSLCWVTLTKMVAILMPFRYEQLLSTKRCYVIIVCLWIFGIVLTAVGFRLDVKWNQTFCITANSYYPYAPLSTQIGLLLGIAVPLTVTVYASGRILIVIVKTNLQITAQVNSIGGTVGVVLSGPTTVTLQSIRSGRNILLICAAELVLTLPMIILIVFSLVLSVEMSESFQFVSVWSVMCNSPVNGILYMCLFRSVRMKILHMFRDVCNSVCLA